MNFKNMWGSILKRKTAVKEVDYHALAEDLAKEVCEERAGRIAAERERDMAAAKLGGNMKQHWVAMELGKNNFRAFKKSTAALCVMIEDYALKHDLAEDGELLNIASQSDFLIDQGAFNPHQGFLPEHRMAAICDEERDHDRSYIGKLRELTKFMSRDDFENMPIYEGERPTGRSVMLDEEEWIICVIDGFKHRYLVEEVPAVEQEGSNVVQLHG